jgi:hypothetical protein
VWRCDRLLSRYEGPHFRAYQATIGCSAGIAGALKGDPAAGRGRASVIALLRTCRWDAL